MTEQTEATEEQDTPSDKVRRRVGLFVTCIVDLYRPSVGFASIKLLESAGCDVLVPECQTCCGQPAYNSGDTKSATEIAKKTIAAFEEFDYVVAPSGSCAGMLRHHFPELLKSDSEWHTRANNLSKKTFELVSFLTDVCGLTSVSVYRDGKVAYHDSCSCLREMNVHAQPRQLMSSVGGLETCELKDPEACCGFGGLFSVKYGDISTKIVDRKTDDIIGTGADLLVGPDLGCLLNIAGRLSRENHKVQVRHIAELLADMMDTPAIGKI